MKHHGMAKGYKVHTGSPKPKAPMSKRTEKAAGGRGPGYGPGSAAKHLMMQDKAAPKC